MAELVRDVQGEDVITKALVDLVNTYPKLDQGEEIKFGVLSETGGVSFFPMSGAVIERDTTDILGNHEQICNYPFFIYYKASGLSEGRKVSVKEWLDDLGRWLEKQPITVGNTTSILSDYPLLTGNRKFLTIRRTTPATLDSVGAGQEENWAIRLVARYQNNF